MSDSNQGPIANNSETRQTRRKPRPLLAGLVAATALAGAIGWTVSPWLPASPLLAAAPDHGIDARPVAYPDSGHSVADLVASVQPAVVSITVEEESQPASFSGNAVGGSPFEDFFRQFMGNAPSAPTGPEHVEALGSGFVIDTKGDILTNNHVVDHGTRFMIEFSDKSIAEAKLVGTDPQTDLAVLHVDKMPSITPLSLADSDRLRVGDPVIAIGNPYGVGQTVTAGLVSARGRTLGNSSYVDYIQTDAPINQGNSGGPLLDYSGHVVGVNSAIFSPNGGSVGIGFAVPSNTVRKVVNDLRDNGHVTRAWLGVGIQDVTPAIAAAAGLDRAEGAIVTTVAGDGPSAGKLRPGDIVTRFGDTDIREARDLSQAASSAPIGKDSSIAIVRQGKAQTVAVRLGKLADRGGGIDPGNDGQADQTAKPLGLSAQPLDEDMRNRLGLSHGQAGMVVTDIDPDGPAARAGIRPGDVIERIGDASVGNAADLNKALEQSRNNTALLLLNRQGNEGFLAVPLG